MSKIVKVLLSVGRKKYQECEGHRVEHVAGDPNGVRSAGVGILLTGPDAGAWVSYAAPNRYTHPYIIGAVSPDHHGLNLTRSFALAVVRGMTPSMLARERKKMPPTECERCGRACPLFFVSDKAWSRVGPEWSASVLCHRCYSALTRGKRS